MPDSKPNEAAPEEDLPHFRFFPDCYTIADFLDPLFESSEGECPCCKSQRSVFYVLLDHDAEVERVCPWCIADGRAHAELGLEFNEPAWGEFENVPAALKDEVMHRTPGHPSYQGSEWLDHEGVPMVYLGHVDPETLWKREDRAKIDAVCEALEEQTFDNDPKSLEDQVYGNLTLEEGTMTAYLFRSLDGKHYRAYYDSM